MKAMVLRGGELLVDQVPDPEPGPGQVLVRTLACGVCGSDLHLTLHGERMAQMQEQVGFGARLDFGCDLVMGHEFCAEVLDWGPDAARTLKVGQRVTSIPLVAHGQHLHGVGLSNDAPGGYGELMVLQEALLLPVPEGVSPTAAAFVEPAAVGLHAVEAADLSGAPLCLVVGCGPVGLSVISALRSKGADVLAADFSPQRRELALQMGAGEVLDPARDSPYERLLQGVTPEGYEPGTLAAALGLQGTPRPGAIFECVGKAGILQELVMGAPRDAQIIAVGACMESETFEPLVATGKELSVRFVLGYSPEQFAACLQAVAEGRLQPELAITKALPLGQLPGAFHALLTDPQEGKVMVEHDA